MAISTLEYPVVVPQGTEPPADGPRPYIGNNDDINLAYFREEASEEEWDRYNGWIREQSETRRPYDAQVVDAHSEQIMTRDVFTLRFDEYIMDDVLHYVIKSLRDKLGMDDIPVAFFPSFFFTKLYQKGHADPKLENKYCYKGVAGWTKRMLRGKPIDKMKTIVFFLNLTATHWICFAIFMDLRIIQTFDSTMQARVRELRDLYRWLHTTMSLEGKELNAKEWRLYPTRREDTPMQTNSDCGLYTVLFGICVTQRCSLQTITRERIRAARCLLLLHLIDLQPEKAKPLMHGPVGRQYRDWHLHPFHYAGEDLPYQLGNSRAFDDEDAGVDPTTPLPPHDSDASASNESVVDLMTPPNLKKLSFTMDLITPEKRSNQETKKGIWDPVTPPESDADADAGGSNNAEERKEKQSNSESTTNKESSTGNEEGDGGSGTNAPGSASAGGVGGGGDGNGGDDGKDPDKGKPSQQDSEKGKDRERKKKDRPDGEDTKKEEVGDVEPGSKKKKPRQRRKKRGGAATRFSPRNKDKHKEPTTLETDSVVKQLFTPEKKKTPSPRGKGKGKKGKQKNTTPTWSSPRNKGELPPADPNSKTTDPNSKTSGPSSPKDSVSKADFAPPTIPGASKEAKTQPDSTDKRKGPNLKEPIPKKKKPTVEDPPSTTEKELEAADNVDDPLSRIDPAEPLVDVASLPAGPLVQEEGTETEAEEDLVKPPSPSELGTQPMTIEELLQDDSNTESEDELGGRKQPPSKRARASEAKRLALERRLKSKEETDAAEELKLERILKAPVIRGPPKTQKQVTDFFSREQALARKKLQDSVARRRERGPDWYANLKNNPEDNWEGKMELRRKQARAKAAGAAKRAEKAAQVAADLEAIRNQDKRDRSAALNLYNKYYKAAFQTKGKIVGRSHKRQQLATVAKCLEKNFHAVPALTPEEEQEWADVKKLADKGNRKRRAELKEQKLVKEMSKMMYVPPVWAIGEEPKEDNDEERVYDEDGDDNQDPDVPKKTPLKDPFFMGITYNAATKIHRTVGPLNTEWVSRFFKGVYIQLMMLEPRHWWPLVVGSARDEKDIAPNELRVHQIKIKYQQFDRDLCLIQGVASSLYYCGLAGAAKAMTGLGPKFENLTKPIALKEIKKDMVECAPCIGVCQVFNVRNAKKSTIRELSIDDLIEKKTRFPTLVIPFGKDGANNHSFVVVDDLIFDSTQSCALKLCRESLDWICGEGGIASIDVALRFNRGYRTKEKLPYQERTHW